MIKLFKLFSLMLPYNPSVCSFKAILLADAGYNLQIHNLHAQANITLNAYIRIYIYVKNG